MPLTIQPNIPPPQQQLGPKDQNKFQQSFYDYELVSILLHQTIDDTYCQQQQQQTICVER